MGTALCSKARRFAVDFASVRAVCVKVRRWVRDGWEGARKDIVVRLVMPIEP